MNRSFKSLILLLFFTPLTVNAQWFNFMSNGMNQSDEPRWYSMSRLELCVSYPLSQGFLETKHQIIDPDTREVVNNKQTLSLGTSSGYGYGLAMSFPLTAMGKKSALAISSAVMVSMVKFKSVGLVKLRYDLAYEDDYTYSQAYFPLSLDLKFGGDALYDRSTKYMFNLGFGAYPYITTGSSLYPEFYTGLGGGLMAGGIKPFAKLEAGFFAGIAFKLRMMYTLSPLVFDEGGISQVQTLKVGQGSNPGDYVSANVDSEFKLSTSPDLVLTLCIMPFSRKWQFGDEW
jgi:hypothetical protein